MLPKQSIKDEKCTCVNSWLSPHRKSKCLLNNTLSYFDNTVNKPDIEPTNLDVKSINLDVKSINLDVKSINPDIKPTNTDTKSANIDNQEKKNLYIYVLELVENKFYVGKTTDPEIRIEIHNNYNGSVWTKKYPVVKVLEIIPDSDEFDEDKYTLKYMDKYGINNVRGGSFCEIQLTPDNLTTIKKMINGSTNKCFICGDSGHFANNCKKDYDKIVKILEDLVVDNDLCFRCYRKGHYANSCYAKMTITGEKINNIDKKSYIYYGSKNHVKLYKK
jgi:hypothetical protein